MCSGSTSDPEKKHLFVILNDPYGDDGLVLLASFSTFRDHIFCDPTCVVEGGRSEHPFLHQKSFIRYQKLRIEQAAVLMTGVSSGAMAPREAVGDELFDRICAGVFESTFVAPKHQKFLRNAREAGC